MEEAEKSIVTIDEQDYIFQDLPEEVQHCLVQIQEVRTLITNAELETQRCIMMQRGYIAELATRMETFNSPIVGQEIKAP